MFSGVGSRTNLLQNPLVSFISYQVLVATCRNHYLGDLRVRRFTGFPIKFGLTKWGACTSYTGVTSRGFLERFRTVTPGETREHIAYSETRGQS